VRNLPIVVPARESLPMFAAFTTHQPTKNVPIIPFQIT
jgi:hypothetical protein